MKFDLDDLRLFVAAVDGGSLTAAAARNNVVVAAVSTRLRRMEEAFGLQLFERTGRGIRPTLAGDMLVRHARKLMEDARHVEYELEQFAAGQGGQVRLLSNTNMLAEHMPSALGPFLAAHPGTTVLVDDKPSFEVVTMLRNGEADIGIVAASADMSGLERSRFVPDRLVLVARRDSTPHPEPTNEPIGYSRILDRKLIGLSDKTALMQFMARQAKELGRALDIRFRADGFEPACRMVEAGAGVAIVPESAARRYAAFMDIYSIDIAEGWADRELYLCVKAEAQLPRYARALLQHLKDYAAAWAGD
ncbi:MAG: LysR family transcriptional regulator [Neorhizobium sp.]|nr:LysR family transcriptional regulator [Neorhizobium sp.]